MGLHGIGLQGTLAMYSGHTLPCSKNALGVYCLIVTICLDIGVPAPMCNLLIFTLQFPTVTIGITSS